MHPRRRWLPVAVLALLGLGAGACSSGGTEVAANNLEVGDCVEDEATLNSIDVSAIDCDEDHVFELYHRFDLEDADEYPGVSEVQAEGNQRCGQRFERFVGAPPGAEYTFIAVPPSQETWDEADDRTVLCFAALADGSPTTGSLEGAAA
jgi:Septum formation